MPHFAAQCRIVPMLFRERGHDPSLGLPFRWWHPSGSARRRELIAKSGGARPVCPAAIGTGSPCPGWFGTGLRARWYNSSGCSNAWQLNAWVTTLGDLREVENGYARQRSLPSPAMRSLDRTRLRDDNAQLRGARCLAYETLEANTGLKRVTDARLASSKQHGIQSSTRIPALVRYIDRSTLMTRMIFGPVRRPQHFYSLR